MTSYYGSPSVIERICALGIFIALSPLLLGIGIAISVSAGNPIFFYDKRVGLSGHEFLLVKFRTMSRDTDNPGPAITVQDDKRILRIGRFLRRNKLDELPQLVNVVRGEMAFVGPRPERPEIVARFTSEQKQILSFRPGLTSPASLKFMDESSLLTGADWECLYMNNILPEKLKMDLSYMRNRSRLTDIKIVIRTISSFFTFGAYSREQISA